MQLDLSYHVICEHLARCPVTLIVPYGSMDASRRIMRQADPYAFVVGIAGGLQLSKGPPYYVGRSGPSLDSQAATLRRLGLTFPNR